MKRVIEIADALRELCPTASFGVSNNSIDQIDWQDQSVSRPTDEQILAEVDRLQAEVDAKAYQELRAKEYPPIENYIDGVVKGDQAQIEAYINACLAVKAKYPKPE